MAWSAYYAFSETQVSVVLASLIIYVAAIEFLAIEFPEWLVNIGSYTKA